MTAFTVKVETGGRGGLHAHHLVMQNAMAPASLERLLAGPEKGAVFGLVDRLMCGRLSGGFTLQPRGKSFRAVPPEGVEVAPVPAYVTAGACKPPLGEDTPAVVLDAARSRCAVDLQMHSHTARCRKGGHAGTDDDCALEAVRRPHPETSFEDGLLLARLDVPAMVFHATVISLALCCNNAVYLFAEMSRFVLLPNMSVCQSFVFDVPSRIFAELA